MSSVPQSKKELHQAIKQAFDKLTIDYFSIPEEYSRVLGVEGNVKGTEVSVSDTLAYLIGWGPGYCIGNTTRYAAGVLMSKAVAFLA